MKNGNVWKLALAAAMALAALLGRAPLSDAAEAPATYTGNTHFDLRKVPFSRFGSYIAFSHLAGSKTLAEGLYVRTMHGRASPREVFRVVLLQASKPVPFREVATPTLLRLDTRDGYVEICLAEPKLLLLRGRGVGLRLAGTAGAYGNAFQIEKSRWEVNSSEQDIKWMLTSREGELAVDAPWNGLNAEHILVDFLPDHKTGKFEAAMEEFEGSWHARRYEQGFDAGHATLKHDYQQWLGKMPSVPREFLAAAELAAYVNWSAVVAPEGHLTRPAMFMSKNWMTNVWSWDNCFNAMALTEKDPQLAWDQYMLLIDNQNADGAFPDSTNDRARVWAFSKPPIHGWVLRWMLEHSKSADPQQLTQVYGPLSRWTNWYFKFRDDDGDGVPQYDHGNDSGWDNSTVFRVGPPVEAPDLSAYLVMQMDVLADLADLLGKKGESGEWKRRADELLEKMLRLTWKGDHFVAVHSGDHKTMESESLMLYLPIILGGRLPEPVRAKLVEGLKAPGRFITEHGLATESPRSPFFQRDGYWLGPIWAPSTMIITEGLAAVGEKSLAREIRRNFCEMVAQNGMAENFDAITGAGLRDPAYTWTSSVFLIFAHELVPQ
jgi:glycogen debranching enzyme